MRLYTIRIQYTSGTVYRTEPMNRHEALQELSDRMSDNDRNDSVSSWEVIPGEVQS